MAIDYELEQTIQAACQEMFNIHDAPVVLTRPDEKFGDYATNIAMQLAPKLHKNPREVAEAVAEKLRTITDDRIKVITVAGPGFINITLTDRALFQAAIEASRS